MAENDNSWFQKDPPSLKLRRGKQFMAENDMGCEILSWKNHCILYSAQLYKNLR